jgi:hypothetical protein
VFLDALGAARIPDPTTEGDFCRRFHPCHIVTVHRGLSRFSRRKRYNAVKMLNCRENGTVPLAPREGDRSMFSAYRLSAKYVFPPKNGPVPDWAVNAYATSMPCRTPG